MNTINPEDQTKPLNSAQNSTPKKANFLSSEIYIPSVISNLIKRIFIPIFLLILYVVIHAVILNMIAAKFPGVSLFSFDSPHTPTFYERIVTLQSSVVSIVVWILISFILIKFIYRPVNSIKILITLVIIGVAAFFLFGGFFAFLYFLLL